MKTKLPSKKKVKETTKKVVDKASDTAQSLAGNPNTYKVIAGGIAVYLLYTLVSSVGKKIKDTVSGDNIDDSVGGTGGSTVGSVITPQQATNYAQQLLDAMNENRDSWFFGGTDEETIKNVFMQISNSADFILIYNAFGNKDYNGYNSPLDSWLTPLDSFEPRNLVYWLKSELSQSDGEVYNLVSQVVNNAGFTF